MLLVLFRSCLKFRGGNDNRNGIYSSPTEVISDAILFVYLCVAPSQKMRARFSRDGTICAINSTFSCFNGTNPITGKGIQLRSPTPIMAPDGIWKGKGFDLGAGSPAYKTLLSSPPPPPPPPCVSGLKLGIKIVSGNLRVFVWSFALEILSVILGYTFVMFTLILRVGQERRWKFEPLSH